MTNRPNVTILVPLKNERESLEELVRAVQQVLGQEPQEILFVDDGSTDGSWKLIEELHARDPRIKGVQLRGNFGKSRALSVGFHYAAGEHIITMDADLQDDPSDIPAMRKMLEEYDVVSGWRTTRRENLFRRMLTKTFNGTVRRTTGVQLHDINCGLKAFRREVVKTIKIYGELHRFQPILAAWNGFRVTEMPVQHHGRKYGQSRYGLERILRGFFDLLTVLFLTKYASKPLHLFGRLGLLTAGVGFIIDLVLVIEWIAGASIGGRPLLLLGTILIVVGIQFFTFGLLAEFQSYDREQRQTDPPVRKELL
ncbi:MAG: glycosyltransferase family 2 protein [Candidatus Kerfeldbacteria bacterium]|nr:glycosyltransferase family 2 protein [Candidatus Kerfeldbacteria bacterium]